MKYLKLKHTKIEWLFFVLGIAWIFAVLVFTQNMPGWVYWVVGLAGFVALHLIEQGISARMRHNKNPAPWLRH